MLKERLYKLNDCAVKIGPVVYWMSRDQRVQDNWALLYASELASEIKTPLVVVFCLANKFLDATIRQYGFMIRGLSEVDDNLRKKNIPFFLLHGEPVNEIPQFIENIFAGALVTDFDPLKIKIKWKQEVSQKVSIPFYEVDAHNIVPCRYVSDKQEYGAYTLRPKIKRLHPKFLVDFPQLKKHPLINGLEPPDIDWERIIGELDVDRSVPEIAWLKPGEKAARAVLVTFIKKKLPVYTEKRNDPNQDVCSNLSAYLHFGQISAQRIVLEVNKHQVEEKAAEFLEELTVRRELSDNYCFYNAHYDSLKNVPDWVKKTIEAHRNDPREYLYSLKDFEKAKTHDYLWNAAQKALIKRGKIQGYMRMYWGKKILEWSESPEEAMRIAIYLNDRYELDGRDPNGYSGIAWCIGGVHDRAWGERPVYGKLRYMSYNGAKSKFDVKGYINKVENM